MTDIKNHYITVSRRGGPDVLMLHEEPLPEPAPGEARVRVVAAGVSAYDAMLRSHRFPGAPRPPYTPGEDFVGVVDKLGENVADATVGRPVAAWTFGDAGSYSEYICRPAEELVAVPAGVDPAEAVAAVVNYLTAHLAMHKTAAIQSGERILVHGAAGGVGSALLELGRLSGLEMYGTASAHNHKLVAQLGATPIDYRNEDFVERIRELTGDGVDAVFDVIGGGRQLWRSYRALRRGGRLVMLGMAGTSRSGLKIIPASLLTIGLLKLLPDGKTAPTKPAMAKYPGAHMDWYRETLTELLDYVAAGKMHPPIAARIPLEQASRAHALLERGGHAGKVVLTVG